MNLHKIRKNVPLKYNILVGKGKLPEREGRKASGLKPIVIQRTGLGFYSVYEIISKICFAFDFLARAAELPELCIKPSPFNRVWFYCLFKRGKCGIA
jgi:hypothetical protein